MQTLIGPVTVSSGHGICS